MVKSVLNQLIQIYSENQRPKHPTGGRPHTNFGYERILYWQNKSMLKLQELECAGLPRAARSDEPDIAIEEPSRGELRNQDFSRAII